MTPNLVGGPNVLLEDGPKGRAGLGGLPRRAVDGYGPGELKLEVTNAGIVRPDRRDDEERDDRGQDQQEGDEPGRLVRHRDVIGDQDERVDRSHDQGGREDSPCRGIRLWDGWHRPRTRRARWGHAEGRHAELDGRRLLKNLLGDCTKAATSGGAALCGPLS